MTANGISLSPTGGEGRGEGATAEPATGAFKFAHKVAACLHAQRCRSECNVMPFEKPQPDYIGPRYRGLVIIGANPGIASTDIHRTNDARMFELQSRISTGDEGAFRELMRLLPESMLAWKQVVNRSGREYLNYHIEEIAYINLVKCATTKQSGDVFKIFTGQANGIPLRCWDTHTRPLLEFLSPKFVVALWQPVLNSLRRLGYQFHDVEQIGAYNGQRNLPTELKYADVKWVFATFNSPSPFIPLPQRGRGNGCSI